VLTYIVAAVMPVYRGELSSVLRIEEGTAFFCIFNRVDSELFQRKMVLLMSGDINVQVSRLLSALGCGSIMCCGLDITGRCVGDLCCTVVSGKLPLPPYSIDPDNSLEICTFISPYISKNHLPSKNFTINTIKNTTERNTFVNPENRRQPTAIHRHNIGHNIGQYTSLTATLTLYATTETAIQCSSIMNQL
jgi:hypothetical protein